MKPVKVIVYQGARPSFPLGPDEPVWLSVEENLVTGIADFKKAYGEPTSLEQDLLILASAVFAADLAIKRGMREEIVRDIELDVPIVNFHAINSLRSNLEEILHILSHDNWTLSFRRVSGNPEPLSEWPTSDGSALLFSGGLDSFAGAVDLLEEIGHQKVLLASHVTRNTTTISSQNRLHEHLESRYGKVRRIVVRTGGKDTDEMEFASSGAEVSQRTRSFMFLTIAILAARRSGMSQVVMIAENGQLAIHLPISRGRIGAFSTHTAHPSFVARVAEFFSAATGFTFNISNPYLYKTKAEVVARLAAEHAEAVPLAISCWKSSRIGSGHCGECVPCYIRRIALEHNQLRESTWKRDIFEENVAALLPTDEGKRNLTELASFAADFRNLSDAEIDMEYCELYDECFDKEQAAAMYKRFGIEAYGVLSRYSSLSHLL